MTAIGELFFIDCQYLSNVLITVSKLGRQMRLVYQFISNILACKWSVSLVKTSVTVQVYQFRLFMKCCMIILQNAALLLLKYF